MLSFVSGNSHFNLFYSHFPLPCPSADNCGSGVMSFILKLWLLIIYSNRWYWTLHGCGVVLVVKSPFQVLWRPGVIDVPYFCLPPMLHGAMPPFCYYLGKEGFRSYVWTVASYDGGNEGCPPASMNDLSLGCGLNLVVGGPFSFPFSLSIFLSAWWVRRAFHLQLHECRKSSFSSFRLYLWLRKRFIFMHVNWHA